MAIAISQAENGTRACDRKGAKNSNGTHDWGVFQINEVHLKKGYSLADFKDCLTNIRIAHEIFKRQGWSPWSVYKNGSFKRFLTN
jgi:hypothetical protein